MPEEVEEKEQEHSGWHHVGEGCGCLLTLLGIAVFFNFASILAVIAKFAE